MKLRAWGGAFLCAVVLLGGCRSEVSDGPPEVRIGDSMCDECGMILSDVRFATVTSLDGPRGAEPRVFDDFNCQVNYENSHPDRLVLMRWSHDYSTSQWIKTNDAFFVISPELHTPMASQTAAFLTKDGAKELQMELGGELLTFSHGWERLGSLARQSSY